MSGEELRCCCAIEVQVCMLSLDAVVPCMSHHYTMAIATTITTMKCPRVPQAEPEENVEMLVFGLLWFGDNLPARCGTTGGPAPRGGRGRSESRCIGQAAIIAQSRAMAFARVASANISGSFWELLCFGWLVRCEMKRRKKP